MTERDKIKARIKALLAKTTARGATEAEALSAAEKAAELMREYGLAEGEVEMQETTGRGTCGEKSVRTRLWNSLAIYTNCELMLLGGGSVEFVGEAPGPEVAAYLMTVCDRAIDRELRAFRSTTWYKRRRTLKAKRLAGDDFVAGMVSRLERKLRELFASQVNPAARSRAAAVMKLRHPDSHPVSFRGAAGVYFDAYFAGKDAATGINLAHGVAGGGKAALIGGGS